MPANHLRPGEHDLLHVFGLRAAADVDAQLQRLPSHPPLVVTPYADDPAREEAWGSALVAATLSNAGDARQRAMYFDAIRDRRLESQGQLVRGVSPYDGRPALKRAAAVIASSEEEARRLGEEFGVPACKIVPGVLAPQAGDEDIAALSGLDDFVFVHAAMEPRGNQLAIVAAAAELGYPLVLTGPVLDTAYYGECCAAFGDLGIWIGSEQLTPSSSAPGAAGSLPMPPGPPAASTACSRAGAAGASLVAPAPGYARGVWPGLVRLVDPASMRSVRGGFQEAWERAPELGPATAARTIAAADPFRSLVGVVSAYQQASGAVPSQT